LAFAHNAFQAKLLDHLEELLAIVESVPKVEARHRVSPEQLLKKPPALDQRQR